MSLYQKLEDYAEAIRPVAEKFDSAQTFLVTATHDGLKEVGALEGVTAEQLKAMRKKQRDHRLAVFGDSGKRYAFVDFMDGKTIGYTREDYQKTCPTFDPPDEMLQVPRADFLGFEYSPLYGFLEEHGGETMYLLLRHAIVEPCRMIGIEKQKAAGAICGVEKPEIDDIGQVKQALVKLGVYSQISPEDAGVDTLIKLTLRHLQGKPNDEKWLYENCNPCYIPPEERTILSGASVITGPSGSLPQGATPDQVQRALQEEATRKAAEQGSAPQTRPDNPPSDWDVHIFGQSNDDDNPEEPRVTLT